MKYGYARVSTYKQAVRGNSLEEQITALKNAGAEIIYQDMCTGTKVERPEFQKLLDTIQSGDTLIVTKLDRFARTAIDGGTIVRKLHEDGITINVLNLGIADNTPMGRLMVTMLLGFAEFERDMIVERTMAGKEIARKNGVCVDGRPRKYNRTQREHALELIRDGNTYRRVTEMTGISKSTLIRLKKASQ